LTAGSLRLFWPVVQPWCRSAGRPVTAHRNAAALKGLARGCSRDLQSCICPGQPVVSTPLDEGGLMRPRDGRAMRRHDKRRASSRRGTSALAHPLLRSRLAGASWPLDLRFPRQSQSPDCSVRAMDVYGGAMLPSGLVAPTTERDGGGGDSPTGSKRSAL
jgi:hypothetical protein